MTYKTNMLNADQCFGLPGHNFRWHEKSTLIVQLNNTELDKELLTFILKKHKDFWIHKLKTLKPHGYNAELNFPNPSNFCISTGISQIKKSKKYWYIATAS